MAKATMKRPGRAASMSDTVTIRRAEYERLLVKAGERVRTDDVGGPPLPKPDAGGNFPAVDYMRASIARELIRQRNAVALSQTELAELSGVRRETISRLESGKHTVSARVMERIEGTLRNREAASPQRKAAKRKGR